MKKCKHYFFKVKGLILFSLMSVFFIVSSCGNPTSPPKKDDPVKPLYGPKKGVVNDTSFYNKVNSGYIEK